MDLFNVLKSEFLKLKKDTMFYIGTIITMLVPVLVILKDKVISAPPKIRNGLGNDLLSC